MSNSAETSFGARYEIRDYTLKSSKKKFHVLDRKTKREVFHTDNRDRAEMLVSLAGDRDITQHLKDHGHHFVEDVSTGRCEACK